MRKSLFFKIPSHNQEIKARLIEMIPSHWSCAHGMLFAPEEDVLTGSIEDRNVIFGNGPDPFKKECKDPAVIFFHEAGSYPQFVTFLYARYIAARLLRRGYRGDLIFFGRNEDRRNPCSIRCQMVFNPEPEFAKADDLDPNNLRRCIAGLSIEWESDYDNNNEDLLRISDFCRSLDLKLLPGLGIA